MVLSSSREVERLAPQLEPLGVRPREQQQVVADAPEPARLVRRDGDRAAGLLAAHPVGLRELELARDDGQRRPQLVADVGDELALARQCAAEPGQRRVERAQRTADRHVARQPDQHERERRAQPQHAPQLGERLVAVLERRAGDDPVPVPADVDGGGLDPRAVGLERLRAGLLEGVEVDLLAGLVVHVDARRRRAGRPARRRGPRAARPGRARDAAGRPGVDSAQAPVRPDHLGERLARVVEPPREPRADLAALDEQPRDRRRRASSSSSSSASWSRAASAEWITSPTASSATAAATQEGGRDAQPQAHGPMR